MQDLQDLVRRKATGELICASESVEVHVYVQRGRIAWATDSTRPLAFTRYLLERAKIDPKLYGEVLESCRRERRPLGETLVASGLATREEVREALAHQIRLAIEVLRSAGPLQTLFLDRKAQFSTYDSDLTFELDEFLNATGSVSAPSSSPPVCAVPQSSARPSAAARVHESFEGVAWVEMLEWLSLVEAVPEPSTRSKVPAELVQGTLLDGAELVVVRRSTTTLAGVALSASRSLWCLANAELTVGAVVTALTSLVPEQSSAGEPLATHGEPWSVGSCDAEVGLVLREILERASEIYGAFVTDPTTPSATCGIGRPALSAERLVSLVDRRAMALSATDRVDGAGGQDSDGVSLTRVMTAERQFYVFATSIVTGGYPRFVWLIVDKHCSKGVGWAFLTSVGRQLVRALRGEPQ